MATVDWSEPGVDSGYQVELEELLDRDLNNVLMDYSGDSNVPTGAIQYDASDGTFEKYNGSSWIELTFKQISGPAGSNFKVIAATSQNVEVHPFNALAWSFTQYDLVPANHKTQDLGSTIAALAVVYTAKIEGPSATDFVIDAQGDLQLMCAGTEYFRVDSDGIIDLRGHSVSGSAGAVVEYVQIRRDGNDRKIALLATS